MDKARGVRPLANCCVIHQIFSEGCSTARVAEANFGCSRHSGIICNFDFQAKVITARICKALATLQGFTANSIMQCVFFIGGVHFGQKPVFRIDSRRSDWRQALPIPIKRRKGAADGHIGYTTTCGGGAGILEKVGGGGDANQGQGKES